MPGMSSVIGQYPAGVRLLSLLESEVDSKALATKLTQAIEQLLQEATTTKGGPSPWYISIPACYQFIRR
jgi:hypothetical protein